MESHFTNQIEPLNLANSGSTSQPQPNCNLKAEVNSREQDVKGCNSYTVIPNTEPHNLSTAQAPPFEIPETANHQNYHYSRHGFYHSSLLHDLNNVSQRNCDLESLVNTKDTELNVFRKNEKYLKMELGSLQQKLLSEEQQTQNLLKELENLSNTTVSKDQYEEVIAQNKTIAENNMKLSDENKVLVTEANQVQLVKAEGGRLLIENKQLKEDLDEANKNLQNVESQRLEVQTRWRNLTLELQLVENVKNSEISVEKDKVNGLEEELTNLKEVNKSQVEHFQNELAGANALIIELNSQLKSSCEQYKLLSDQSYKLSMIMEHLSSENESLAAKVSGLEDGNSVPQKLKDDTTSQTAPELVSECEKLKEELESEKKRSAEFNETVRKQSETMDKLNTRCQEGKQELERKSNIILALENLLEKAEYDLVQEKTLVSRQKSQVEELEVRIYQAEQKNKELAMIIEGQEEQEDAKTIVINQHEVLIASLKTQILQLEQNVQEKNMTEKDKSIEGESNRVQVLSSQLQNHELDTAKLQRELDEEKAQNKEKQKEMDDLREYLKEMDSEIIQHDYIVEQLQKEIKQRDDEILAEKSANERLLGEKAELEAKLQSEVSARSSSMVNEHQSCLSQNLSPEKLEVSEQRGHKLDLSEIADDNDSLRKRLRLA
ncbi:unnamed protein product [Orchesella dallaii]|uniref:Uncharacterized protein n=1 Tax=Orchesella dallaii TaxID=48710 RepID=A0ABP1RI11_9HEXA